jgi:NADP-dependent 3-hydroxy acid dehydrogenase YdfG
MTASRPLEDKVALVTGASSGIGAATARAIAAAGASVALLARRADRLRDLADEIARDGGKTHVIEADLIDEAVPREAVGSAIGALGRLDLVVNNAGIVDVAPIEKADLARFARMLELNTLVPMRVAQAAIPHLRAAGGGDIVNLSSTSGLFTAPGVGGYSASKHGVAAFSEALRREVTKADKIRVTVIEPGPVATEITGHIRDETARKGIADWLASIVPLQPEDVADAILYAVTRPRHVHIDRLLIRPTDSDTEL